ncbi:MAG: BatA domain-containing protein [Planctomycetaceae bacterium]
MSLLNPVFLYGLAFTAIPVILHFLMRPKPKKLLFPALRLVKVRRRQSVRRLRLRHIWLLLMRIAVICLIVIAVARPSLPAADYSLTGYDWFRIIGCIAFSSALYYGVVQHWRRQSLNSTTFSKRRDQLRGGIALLTLLLLGLFVAWPYQQRVVAQIREPIQSTRGDLPIAGVFIFDTSVSMEYRQENETRLAVAQRIAGEFLEELSPRSRVAIMDTASREPPIFQADLQSARSKLSSLETKVVGLSLNERIRMALQLHADDRERVIREQGGTPDAEQQDLFVREIYLFTDLASSGWQLNDAEALRSEIANWPNGHIYLVDVGPTNPVNVGLNTIRLSREQVTLGGEFTLSARLQQTGDQSQELIAELHLADETGKMVKQGQTTIAPKGAEVVQVDFSVRPQHAPITQGEIRLINSDPLARDDLAYFTVDVAPPLEVLVIAPREGEATLWMQALAPSDLIKQKKNRYRCTYRAPGLLTAEELRKFGVVCLLNVPEPSAESWGALSTYVQAGGGLFVSLGSDKINPVSYQSQTALEVLPGKVLAFLRFTPPSTLDLQNLQHPMLSMYQKLGGADELSMVYIRRYWRVKPSDDAGVIIPYADDRRTPALLECSYGLGRTLLLTTGVDLRGEWSDIPLAGWSWVAFADQAVEYLAQRSTRTHNFVIGEEVPVWYNTEPQIAKIMLRKPQGQQQSIDVNAEKPPLLVTTQADQLGQYQAVAAEETIPFETGFSLNLAPGESDFERVTETDLQSLLGEGRFSIAKHLEDLELKVGFARVGIEAFPWIMIALLIIFAIEHLSANRFYESEETPAVPA